MQLTSGAVFLEDLSCSIILAKPISDKTNSATVEVGLLRLSDLIGEDWVAISSGLIDTWGGCPSSESPALALPCTPTPAGSGFRGGDITLTALATGAVGVDTLSLTCVLINGGCAVNGVATTGGSG